MAGTRSAPPTVGAGTGAEPGLDGGSRRKTGPSVVPATPGRTGGEGSGGFGDLGPPRLGAPGGRGSVPGGIWPEIGGDGGGIGLRPNGPIRMLPPRPIGERSRREEEN